MSSAPSMSSLTASTRLSPFDAMISASGCAFTRNEFACVLAEQALIDVSPKFRGCLNSLTSELPSATAQCTSSIWRPELNRALRDSLANIRGSASIAIVRPEPPTLAATRSAYAPAFAPTSKKMKPGLARVSSQATESGSKNCGVYRSRFSQVLSRGVSRNFTPSTSTSAEDEPNATFPMRLNAKAKRFPNHVPGHRRVKAMTAPTNAFGFKKPKPFSSGRLAPSD